MRDALCLMKTYTDHAVPCGEDCAANSCIETSGPQRWMTTAESEQIHLHVQSSVKSMQATPTGTLNVE
jgi:hypothetical protein